LSGNTFRRSARHGVSIAYNGMPYMDIVVDGNTCAESGLTGV
jgi:hypothetical protein